jgi:GNAT superfamily N-acetyltransferase
MDDRECRGTDALAELARAEGLLAPVDGDADAQRWMDCDLASFAEHRCDEIVDPSTLDETRRSDLSRRALAPDEDLADPRTDGSWLARFWIVDGTERLGTLAIARGSYWRFAPVSSLYVFPAARGRGIAYRALRSLQELAPRAGLQGIRLGTFWAWQANVRRYVYRYGMWAYSFKRSIDFV